MIVEESQKSSKSSLLNEKKIGGFEHHSYASSREERRGSSGVLDDGRKEKNLDQVKNGSDHLSMDDEFVSFVNFFCFTLQVYLLLCLK